MQGSALRKGGCSGRTVPSPGCQIEFVARQGPLQFMQCSNEHGTHTHTHRGIFLISVRAGCTDSWAAPVSPHSLTHSLEHIFLSEGIPPPQKKKEPTGINKSINQDKLPRVGVKNAEIDSRTGRCRIERKGCEGISWPVHPTQVSTSARFLLREWWGCGVGGGGARAQSSHCFGSPHSPPFYLLRLSISALVTIPAPWAGITHPICSQSLHPQATIATPFAVKLVTSLGSSPNTHATACVCDYSNPPSTGHKTTVSPQSPRGETPPFQAASVPPSQWHLLSRERQLPVYGFNAGSLFPHYTEYSFYLMQNGHHLNVRSRRCIVISPHAPLPADWERSCHSRAQIKQQVSETERHFNLRC